MLPPIEQVLRSQLTPDQYNAATDTANEVLTLACAGSGKSRTLAYRIARLIAGGESADSIVAFTFTEKAAESIKLRVAQALIAANIAPTVLGAMYIGTIHSYCQNILGEMDARYRQFDVLDENRLKLYLISRYPRLGIQPLRAQHQERYFETIEQVADAWKTVNDEMIQLQAVTANDPLLGTILMALQTELNHDQFIDFSLMIRLVADALQEGDHSVRRAVLKLRHLMVDEYQDVNPAQEILIRELHNLSDTLFVVGDDDQSIYGFRGADVTNILTFQQRYPNTSPHTLSVNYRSTQAIVEAADRFIAAEMGPNRITKNPTAFSNSSPRDFRNVWFDSRTVEAEWVATRIQSLLGTAYNEKDKDGNIRTRGLTPGDFAILMRSTRSAEQDDAPRHAPFTQALTNRQILYSLERGGSVFDRPQVNALLRSLNLLHDNPPTREDARRIFDNVIMPAYPHANFNRFVAVLTQWGRRIHTPVVPGGARQKLYPQQLVHDLLNAFVIEQSNFDDSIMQDIGVFSRILQDVETVYLSIDTAERFRDILHFLEHVARNGYDRSTDDVLRRPDAVTVATVHKMKGLEFPVVFIVDAEALRFPGTNRNYAGWLPDKVIQPALIRGAYRSNPDEEARLFYTALTRAERYLYVSGCAHLPNGGVRPRKPSRFSLRLAHPELSNDPAVLPQGLTTHSPEPRIDETVVPTTYSDIRYYLSCPRDYQYRKSFGFSPPVPELFGYGKTVHTTIEKLHELFPEHSPDENEIEKVVNNTFHLKHVFQSNDPVNHPGPYERALNTASDIAKSYVQDYAGDFTRQRQVEVRFEIPVTQAVITGSIDLLLKKDEEGNILDASVIDFKSMGGEVNPLENEKLHWTELSLQVQLYAKAARDVLGENAQTGAVHLLKDNQRIDVPITDEAINNAVANVEWAVERIIEGDFPMRPEKGKCEACDFRLLCPKLSQKFVTISSPPPIHIPGNHQQAARAFSQFDNAEA